MPTSLKLAVLALVSGVVLGGCAASARQRPMSVGDVPTGVNTVSGVRQQLAGTWVLDALTVAKPGAAQQAVDAAGTLTADAHGNVTIEYRITDAGQEQLTGIGVTVPRPIISTSGPVTIDVQRSKIIFTGEDFQRRMQEYDASLAAARDNPFALAHPRFYAFGADGTLTLTSRYAQGGDAAVSRWRRK